MRRSPSRPDSQLSRGATTFAHSLPLSRGGFFAEVKTSRPFERLPKFEGSLSLAQPHSPVCVSTVRGRLGLDGTLVHHTLIKSCFSGFLRWFRRTSTLTVQPRTSRDRRPKRWCAVGTCVLFWWIRFLSGEEKVFEYYQSVDVRIFPF